MKQLFYIIAGIAAANWIFSEASPTVGKMNAYRFTPVYSQAPTPDKPGKTNILFAEGKSGVYIIKENGVIVYVGQSQTNLYRTITRHFQEWNDRNSPNRISYKNRMNRNRYTVRIVFVSPQRALKLETMLIKKYKPRDNAAKLNEIESFYEPTPAEEKVLAEYQTQYFDEVPF